LLFVASRYARNFIPVGQHGLTHVGQTQFYHLYGPVGAAAVIALPLVGIIKHFFPKIVNILGGYLWYKTAKFTAKKFYYHVLLGERTWLYEMEKNQPTVGDYYFSDSPFSSDEDFPDLARGEMGKKKLDTPEWAKKK